MLVDRQVVRGFSLPKVAANDTMMEFELCVEQNLNFYEDKDIDSRFIEVTDTYYILNGNYVDEDELRITLGGKYKAYIAEAIKNMEY